MTAIIRETRSNNGGIYGFPSYLKPRLSQFNGIDDSITIPLISFLSTDSWEFSIHVHNPSSHTVAGNSSNTRDFFSIKEGEIVFRNSLATQYKFFTAFQRGLYKYSYDGVDTLTVLMPDGTLLTKSSVIGSFTFNNIGSGYTGDYYQNSISYAKLIKNGDVLFEYLMMGNSIKEYDISGNENHGTWNGTGDKKSYSIYAETRQFSEGLSLWQKSGSPDIFVPFDINGAISLVDGVDIEAGYSKTSDIPANDTSLINSDLKMDFNPSNTYNESLELFNRSNEEIHNDSSRSSEYYNQDNPYEYHMSELIDYDIYNSLFEPEYKDRLFVKYEDFQVISVLNYNRKQVGGKLEKIKEYCDIINASI